MSPACGPMVSTQPNTTSSTAAGSTSTPFISARMECAPRSAGCTCASAPPRRPTGLRTASMMYASDIRILLRQDRARDAAVMKVRVTPTACQRPGALQVEVKVVLGGVADRTVALERGSAGQMGGGVGFGLRHRDIDGRLGITGRDRRCGPVHQRTCEFEGDARVGEVVLDRLEGADRDPELPAVADVVDRHVEH